MTIKLVQYRDSGDWLRVPVPLLSDSALRRAIGRRAGLTNGKHVWLSQDYIPAFLAALQEAGHSYHITKRRECPIASFRSFDYFVPEEVECACTS